jgi:hypothetical protein
MRDHLETFRFDRLQRAARGWLNITVWRELFLAQADLRCNRFSGRQSIPAILPAGK